MDHSEALSYFPSEKLGNPLKIASINVGLSGSLVYTVTTNDNEFIMRIHRSINEQWSRILSVQSQVSQQQVTPEIYFVDEKKGIVISKKINGAILGQALRNPANAPIIFSSLINNLQKLHSLPHDNILDIDPMLTVLDHWSKQSIRADFPSWASSLNSKLQEISEILKTDQRKVVSHNDLNPGNILFDEKRVWFIDWEIAGLNHPYYDLATLSTFLNLPIEAALGLLSSQEKSELTLKDQMLFQNYCRLNAILYGTLFLSMVPDLNLLPKTSLEDTITLSGCYELMGKGELNLQSSMGQGMFAMAMLKKACQ